VAQRLLPRARQRPERSELLLKKNGMRKFQHDFLPSLKLTLVAPENEWLEDQKFMFWEDSAYFQRVFSPLVSGSFRFVLKRETRDNLEDQTNNLVASAPGAARPGVKITSSNLLCVSIHRDVRQFWEDIITSVQLKTDFRKWICSSSFTKQKF